MICVHLSRNISTGRIRVELTDSHPSNKRWELRQPGIEVYAYKSRTDLRLGPYTKQRVIDIATRRSMIMEQVPDRIMDLRDYTKTRRWVQDNLLVWLF